MGRYDVASKIKTAKLDWVTVQDNVAGYKINLHVGTEFCVPSDYDGVDCEQRITKESKNIDGAFYIFKEKVPEIKKTEAVIVSVGDIFMHDTNINAGYEKATQKHNFDSVFSATKNYFEDADVSTTWLGAVYGPKGPYLGYPLFKSPVELIDTLQNIGLDVAYRTNHTMDFGTKGLNETSQILKDHNINQAAGYATEEASKEIYVYPKDDLKIAFIGYIYGMNGLPIPEPWMINLIDLEKDGRKVFVAYGLGNFYCDQREKYTDAGMILRYVIEKVDGKTSLKNVSYIPTSVARYKEKGRTQFKVLPSKEYIKLYEQKQAGFLSVANYNRFKTNL